MGCTEVIDALQHCHWRLDLAVTLEADCTEQQILVTSLQHLTMDRI